MTENKNNFICIIAGYEDALDKCFFSVNDGLNRRFPFRYNIDKYTKNELFEILLTFIKDNKWNISTDVLFEKLENFIYNNYDNFPNFGGDIENYFFSLKLAHSKRIFLKPLNYKKILTLKDFEKGMELFLENKNKNKKDTNYLSMYL